MKKAHLSAYQPTPAEKERHSFEAGAALRQYELNRLCLQHGDVLMVSIPDFKSIMCTEIGRQRVEKLKKYFTDTVPGVMVLLVDREEQIGVVKDWENSFFNGRLKTVF